MFLHIAHFGINPYLDIIIMLAVAFLLGYLLKSVLADSATLKRKISALEENLQLAGTEKEKLKLDLSEAVSKDNSNEVSALENELRISKNKIIELEREVSRLRLSPQPSILNDQLEAANSRIKELEKELNNSNEKPSMSIATSPIASKPSKKGDDLTKVEGIGPKIQSLCNEIGIYTFRELAKSNITDLRKMLDAEGKHFAVHDPASWPAQAQLAADDKWEELENWQKELKGGRE